MSLKMIEYQALCIHNFWLVKERERRKRNSSAVFNRLADYLLYFRKYHETFPMNKKIPCIFMVNDFANK